MVQSFLSDIPVYPLVVGYGILCAGRLLSGSTVQEGNFLILFGYAIFSAIHLILKWRKVFLQVDRTVSALDQEQYGITHGYDNDNYI